MSNQKVIDKGIKLCQLIDYARHRSRIPGARRVWPCNPTLQRPAWYGSFPPTQDWSLATQSIYFSTLHRFGDRVELSQRLSSIHYRLPSSTSGRIPWNVLRLKTSKSLTPKCR